MSEALKKVSGIKHLPLFPLPLVLLPNELLPLHIFEDRYQKMLIDVQSERQLFGVTHFEPGESLIEKPQIGTVGCVAEIRESQPLPDGRANIITVGLIRYRLLGYVEAGEPYFIGDVEFFEDEPEEQSALHELSEEVHELFERVAKAAFKLSDNRGKFPDIPKTDPEQLSFLITAAFNLDNELKYRLLETHSTSDRMNKLKEILEQTVNKMEESAEIHKISQSNGHTKKKLDI
jgi:ATP-dependent Lon protease